MSNQYITQSDTNIHKNDIYYAHETKPNKKSGAREIFWNTRNCEGKKRAIGRNLLNVINLNVSSIDNKRIQNDFKLLSIKNESKQFKSNFNPHFITTLSGKRNDVDHIFRFISIHVRRWYHVCGAEELGQGRSVSRAEIRRHCHGLCAETNDFSRAF